jgi:hypothetical protein
VKIQELSCQPLSPGNMDLAKKVNASTIDQSETVTDSYVFGGELSNIEKEVLQVLKAIAGDFTNAIDTVSKSNHNVHFPDVQIRLSGEQETSLSEHAIIMLFLSRKGEAPVNPAKIFLSYSADGPSTDIPILPVSVEKVIEEARQFTNTPAGKKVATTHDAREYSDGDVAEFGFVIKFSFLPQLPDKEHAGMSGFITNPSSPEDGVPQAVESVITYQVSGKIIDGHYASSLSLKNGGDDDVFIKLTELLSGASSDIEKAANNEMDLMSQKGHIAKQDGNSAAMIGPAKMMMSAPFQPVHEEEELVVVSFEISKEKHDAAYTAVPAKSTNELTDSKESELRGATLGTGFGQGELKSSPMAGPPLPPMDNDVIVEKALKFVNALNALFNGDVAVDETRGGETPVDGAVTLETSLGKLRILQARLPEMRSAIQNTAKKILGEFYDMADGESIGLSLGKNGSFHLDASQLISQLASKKEETMNAMKGIGNALYERTNYLMHPYAGMYIDNKNILQLKATRKDEGASLLNQELQKEQDSLEKRLKELQLLIERSALLTEWFAQGNMSIDGRKEADSGA